ncbi:MAG: hypothetical protein M3N19_12035, partial [Candidatus Eremiobacteraeota bacterium]|nr:hypothetical protein [Candidatus Eremiobacteraeota bacterium]
WVVARVRAATGDQPGYMAAVRKAHDLLVERIARIRNPERAEQYARIRYNAEIVAAASSAGSG